MFYMLYLKTNKTKTKMPSCFFNRLKKLDKFQDSIIEELEKLEKDSQSLKELEKEFAVCVFKDLKIILKPHFVKGYS